MRKKTNIAPQGLTLMEIVAAVGIDIWYDKMTKSLIYSSWKCFAAPRSVRKQSTNAILNRVVQQSIPFRTRYGSRLRCIIIMCNVYIIKLCGKFSDHFVWLQFEWCEWMATFHGWLIAICDLCICIGEYTRAPLIQNFKEQRLSVILRSPKNVYVSFVLN